MGMRRVRPGLPALLIGLLASLWIACASTPDGVRHVVRPGENLYRISLHYGVPVQTIALANGIKKPGDLTVGQKIFIPGTHKSRAGKALVPPDDVLRELARREGGGPGPKFSWPIRGRITSRYGPRWGRMHEGIDIGAKTGTPIRSAAPGRIVYSGVLGGYGNVVIVKHPGAFATVYAHNRKNKVKKGQKVGKGHVIAEVGATGRATGPHLHFEVRREERPRDPMRYLP